MLNFARVRKSFRVNPRLPRRPRPQFGGRVLRSQSASTNKGFTLIEMLVVIAIIGILAGIILVALGGMRTKAKDSRIIAEMGQLRNAAMLYCHNQTPNTYSGIGCGTISPNIKALCDDIGLQGGTLIDPFPVSGDGQAYCVEVQLNSGKWWCVDSQGRSARYDTTEPACAVGGPYTCD